MTLVEVHLAKRKAIRDFSAEEAKKYLHYDPESGVFTRIGARGGYPHGSVVGTKKDGYVLVGLFCSQYRAHHIAWLMMTGDWPPVDMDVEHIDRNRSNNRWSNLRLATRSQNNMNAGVRSDNKSGVRGVGQRKDTGKWYARIRAHNVLHLLGHYDTFEEACAARAEAEKIHFGEYAPR